MVANLKGTIYYDITSHNCIHYISIVCTHNNIVVLLSGIGSGVAMAALLFG